MLYIAPDWLYWYYDKAAQTGADWFTLPPSGDLYACQPPPPPPPPRALVRTHTTITIHIAIVVRHHPRASSSVFPSSHSSNPGYGVMV